MIRDLRTAAGVNFLPEQIRAMVEQLGGERIFAMAFETCTYSVRGDDTQRPPSKGPAGLTLHVAHGLRRAVKATHVVIELEDSDTYTVSLVRVSSGVGFSTTTKARLELVHAEDLRQVVEQMTGLRMGL